jgi:hypothetical protein
MARRQLRRRRENAFKEQGGLCWYCKQPMIIRTLRDGERAPPNLCTLEHVRPKGHPDRRADAPYRNVAACYDCNQKAGHRHVEVLIAQGYNKQLHEVPHIGIIGGLMRAYVMPLFLRRE